MITANNSNYIDIDQEYSPSPNFSPMDVNKCRIVYNDFWEEYQVSYIGNGESDEMYGYPVGEFKTLEEAKECANNAVCHK